MKSIKEWVWVTEDSKRFFNEIDAVDYSIAHVLNLASVKKARAQVWQTEDGSKFFEYDAAFKHESDIVGF